MITTKKMTMQAEATWSEEKECWEVSLAAIDFFDNDTCCVSSTKYEIDDCDNEDVFACAISELYGLDTPNGEEVRVIEEKTFE